MIDQPTAETHLPHEFTGPTVNDERICKYCSGTPRECAFVFGPYCEKRPIEGKK